MEDKIELYLNGAMTSEEQQHFRQEMEQSPELSAQVRQMQLLVGALKQKKLRQDIQLAEVLIQQKNIRRKRWLLGLALAGLLLVGFLYFNNRTDSGEVSPLDTKMQDGVQEPTPLQAPTPTPGVQPGIATQKPIAQARKEEKANAPRYRKLPADPGLPADGVALADAFLISFSPYPYLNMAGLNTLWEAGKYVEYIGLIDDLNEKNGVKDAIPSVELVRAACYLHLHQPSRASRLLDPLLAEKDPLRAEAAWLLALCYVMEGKDESAEAALSGIRGKYAAQAKALLDKMQ